MVPKEALLKRLEALPPTLPEETVAKSELTVFVLTAVRKRVEEEDDIEVGTSTMSLKDTLSYMRIKTPVRSSRCTHNQCFDAFWWLESNLVHPQWLCPLCNKELRFEELIVDG
jgi:E3 SUMO-protein ligase PIAS1